MHNFLAALTAAFLACSCTGKSSSSKVVNVATWSNYVSPEVVQRFEQKTGIRVQISNYSSNEELLAKLQAGASGYDLAVPSDYMVLAMSKLGLLQELDHSKFTHLKELDPKLMKRPFDPTNKYSVPYDWGTTGIAINRALYKGKLKGWKDLFGNAQLAGKFTLLDDARETLGAALKASGYSLNTVKPEELEKAKLLLLKYRKDVKAFTSEPTVPLSHGETAVAHAYVSDSLQARKAGAQIEYIIPEEGCTLWIDSWVIPKGGEHVVEAHAFVDFLLDAQNTVITTQTVFVSPANRSAISLLPPALQKDPAIFPSDAQLKKCEAMQDLGDKVALWDRTWTEIKARAE